MNGHFVCDICGAIRPASETVHICEHARKPDALCVKECTHWGRSQEECISDHDGLCKGKDGELFRDYCDTRCACLYPAKRKLPAPPLPIRAPGHGQVTEEERVERVRKAFKVAWDTMAHVDINVDRDKIWFDKHPTMIEAMFGLSDAIKALAAADAVPGPEVEWTGEPPKEPGWYWTKHKPGRVPGNTVLQFDTTPQVIHLNYGDGGGLACWGWYLNGADPDDFEWWPVPISEPPVTKGTT